MKKISQHLALLLALGLSALAASAQDDSNTNTPPPGDFPGPRGHRPPPPLIIGALDANHDGVIDADEIANASAALLTLDKNGDGKLTPDEYLGLPPGASTNDPALPPPDDMGGPGDNTNPPPPGMHGHGPRGHHPPLPAVVRALDTNHDGVIDANEIANASAALKTLDKNGDGKLTPDEFMGFRHPGGPRGGDGPGMPPGGDPDQGGGPGPDDQSAPPQDPPQQ